MTNPFPNPAYSQHVLQPAYADAQAYLFAPMLDAHDAHAVMLAGCGIITAENAAAIVRAVAAIRAAGVESYAYQPGIEDIFFRIEGEIIAQAGADYGGNLQLARSRNDLGHALARMALRRRVLDVSERVLALRTAVMAQARRHLNTLMPGYTHTQPAQPVTFAHYLAGVLTFLAHDQARLVDAYAATNASPLGAAALTGTGFPIDRQRVADLLGFDSVVASTQHAIGGGEYLTETAFAVQALAVDLSRMTHDLLIRATQEANALHIDDSFIQISSIMPQKRNPVVLEHIRTRIGWVYGHANAIATLVHGAAFGDTNDVDDPIFVPTAGLFEAATAVLELLEATLASGEFNTARLTATAGDGFTTATALADGLVISFGLPFRTAHHIVSTSVSIATREGAASLTLPIVREAIERVTESELDIDQTWLDAQLDPAAFVAARKTRGGPARSAMEPAMADARRKTNEDAAEIERAKERIATAAANRRTRLAALPR